MNRISYNYRLRNDITAPDGKKYIILVTNINHKCKPHAIGYSVHENYFDEKAQRVKPGCPDYTVINARLTAIKTWLDQLIITSDLSGHIITQAEITDFLKVKVYDTDLIEWSKNYMKDFSAGFTPGTRKTYNTQITKLESFQKKVPFDSITLAWWKKYEAWMIRKGNKKTTRYKTFVQLNCFINKAISYKIIQSNPLDGIKTENGTSNRQFLSLDELKLLFDTFRQSTNIKERHVLQCFLFACCTGMRYGDILHLRWMNIINGFVDLTQQKKEKHNRIPLNAMAESLLPERKGLKDKVFICYSDQKMNDYLDEIIMKAGITKHITFHCARHTFATILLSKSGDLATVSKLLGHSRTATTMIYAHILDDNKKRVVDMMNFEITSEALPLQSKSS